MCVCATRKSDEGAGELGETSYEFHCYFPPDIPADSTIMQCEVYFDVIAVRLTREVFQWDIAMIFS